VHVDVFQQHTSSKTSCFLTMPQAVRFFPSVKVIPTPGLLATASPMVFQKELFVTGVK
jgi:hypothetical protein